ncbi:MAG TPA: hypothetical protein VGJ19_08490 [Streptosporangiaceae bacterium]
MSPLTGVLRESWAMYRRFAAHFLLIAFMFYLVSAIIGALLSLAGIGGGVAAGIINLFFLFLLQAALVKAVQDVRDGRVDLNLADTVRAALPYLLPVAGASILAAIGITIGFILIIVPGLILLTFWSLIVPSIVLGGSPAMASFGASWRTVRGYAWHVFGTFVLVWLLYLAFEIVLAVIFAVLPNWLQGFLSGIVSGTLFAPFLAIVVSLIWYRLTAAHQGGQPTGYGSPENPEPAYPPPPPGGYGAGPTGGYGSEPAGGNQPGGYGNVPGYDAPPAGSNNPPPPSYGSPAPETPPPPPAPETPPGNQAPPSDPWGTRADTPPADGGPGGSYTRPDNPAPGRDD